MSEDSYEFIKNIWQHSPVILVLFVGGFAIFLLLVVNTWRHRRHRKRTRRVTPRY
jgi:hypothetical protein